MSSSSVSKTKMYGKTINAVIIECVLITSFFILFHAGAHGESFRDVTILLLILYPFGISVCTGIVISSLAESRNMVSWKWGVLASAMTLILSFIMVCVPTMWSGLAFIIAPLATLAMFFVFMNSREEINEQ